MSKYELELYAHAVSASITRPQSMSIPVLYYYTSKITGVFFSVEEFKFIIKKITKFDIDSETIKRQLELSGIKVTY